MIKKDFINFTNSIENMREEIIEYFWLIKLKDRHGHLWEIQKVSIEKEKTTLYLGNEGTENYKVCIIPDVFDKGIDNDLEEYEIVYK